MVAAPIRARAPEPMLRPPPGPPARAAADVSFARPTAVAPPPLPEPTPETRVPDPVVPMEPAYDRFGEQRGTRPVLRPASSQPSIGAVPERGFVDRLLAAAGEQVREKFRSKSAAPGAPSALPRPEREAERQVGQALAYGERAGRSPEETQRTLTQDLVDLQADEAKWSRQLGTMLGDFVDPAMLAGGIAAERAVMQAIEGAAGRGIPWAARVLRLSQTPAGAPLVRRLIARATHGLATGGAANVGFQAVGAAEAGRVPSVGELAYTFAVGTALGPAIEAGGALAGAPFRGRAEVPRPTTRPTAQPVEPTVAEGGLRQKMADMIYPEGAERRTRAQRDAETDPLTGLGNRRAFERALERPDAETEIVAFDLNNLKALNDIVGHQAGDDLFRRTGEAIRQANARGFRMGGDEFVVIARRGEGEAVRQAVERTVGEHAVDLPDGRTVQASISGSVGDTYATADAGLQAAKQARKGAAGSARGPAGDTPAPTHIVRMPTRDIVADPARFQFKSLGSEGVSGELKGVTRFNEQLAGVISVWRDPADGRVYVVNGHHRLELAQRLGHPDLNVQFIDAPTAEAARAEGAFINIAEGRGTATDVAKFLRDRHATPADLEGRGITLRSDLSRDGLALSRLAPDIFDQVATAQVPQGWGVAIGSMLDDAVLQREALAAVRGSGKRLTQAEVLEVARQVRDAGTEGVKQDNLFGTQEERQGLFIQRAQLAAAVKKRLASDKRLFGYVAKEGRAEALSQAGETRIDVGAARGLAEGSARSEEIFDRLYTRSGPIADIVNAAARRIARGEKASSVVADIYPAIGDAVGRELDAGRGARPHGGEPPVPQDARSLADEISGATEERVVDSQDPEQAGMFSPGRPQRGGKSRAAADELASNPRYADMARRSQEGSPRWLPSQGPRGVDLRLMDDLEVQRLHRDLTSIPAEQFAGMPAEWQADLPALTAELERRGLRQEAPKSSRAPELRSAESSADPRGRAHVDMVVAGDMFAALRTFEHALRQETGEDLRAAVDNVRQSVEQFRERGVPADNPMLQRLERLAADHPVARPALELRPEGEEAQASMFGEKAGTAASRSLAETERAARGELEVLRQRFAGETDPARRTALARQIAEREKLVNRSGAIGADELATRAAAEEAPPSGDAPDQLALLAPDMPPALKSKIEQMGGAVPDTTDVRTLMEISRKLAEAVAVPLHQGRFRAGLRKAAGVFFPFKEATRVLRFDRIDTVAHEVGHFLSKKYLKNPTMRSANFRGAGRMPVMLPKEAVRELTQMGRDLYGSRRPAGGYGEEGIAEWVSFYVTEHDALAKKAPTFTAWMNDLLTREPMLRAALDQAHASFETYKKVPAAARFDAQISVGERQATAPTVRDYMRTVADDTYDIRAAVQDLGTPRAPSEDAGILARLSRGAWGEGMEWLERGVRKFGTADQRISDGIEETFGPLVRKGRAQELRRYLDAESALERWEHGIDPGFSREDAQAIVDLYKEDPAIQKAAEAAWAHSRALLELRLDVGLLTDVQYQQIRKANLRRVGFYRIFEEQETGKGRGFGGRGGLGSSGLQRQTGSARRVVDPIEAIMRDTYVTAKKVREHQAKRALVEHALATEGGARIAQEVPAPKRPITIPLEQIQQQLREIGLVKMAVDAKTGESFAVELGGPGGAELEGVIRAFQDAHVAGGGEAKDLVFPMLMKGELKWFQVRDRATYDALVGLGPIELDLWRRVMSFPKRLLQVGATTTLEFGGRNIARDVVAQSVFSKAPWRPPLWRHMEGLYHILQKDPVYQRFRLHGSEQATMGGTDRATVQTSARRLFGYFRTLKQAWLDRKMAWSRATPIEKGLYALSDLEHVILSPFEALRTVKEMSETMGRVGEFAGVERQALKRGARPVDAATEAALAARDVGIDFQQLGSATREVNHLVAFFGAWLRGWAQLGRELKARPHVVIPRLVAEVTVPSLALYYLQRNDPVYQDMPEWKRDLFWLYVQRGDDQGAGWDGYGSGKVKHIWMIPKPFELGLLFGTLPELFARWHDQKNPEAGRDLEQLAGRMAPPWIPTAATPLIENYANRSTFRDRPIVPRSRENVDAAEQFAPQTGETARVLGRALGYSPAKIENLVRGYTGGAGSYVLSGTNAIVRFVRAAEGLPPLKTPLPDNDDALLDIPGIKGFVSRIPAEDAESVERLYQDFAAAERRRQTWRSYLKEGRHAEAARYLDQHRDEIMSVASSEELGAGQRGALREAYQQMQQLQEVKRALTQAGAPGGRAHAVEAMRRLGGAVQEVRP